MSRRAAAATFAASLSSIKCWLGKARTGASLAPGRLSGRPQRFNQHDRDTLHARLDAAPDATRAAHIAWGNQQYPNHPVAHPTLDHAIIRLGWSRNKQRCTLPSATRRHALPSASACTPILPMQS
jgi:transposase